MNLFEKNGVIYTDNIPNNMMILLTKEQFVEYMQLKQTVVPKPAIENIKQQILKLNGGKINPQIAYTIEILDELLRR